MKRTLSILCVATLLCSLLVSFGLTASGESTGEQRLGIITYDIGSEPEGCFEGNAGFDETSGAHRTADLDYYMTFKFNIPQSATALSMHTIISGQDAKVEISNDNESWTDLNISSSNDQAWYHVELSQDFVSACTTGTVYIKFSDKNTVDGNGATVWGDISLWYKTDKVVYTPGKAENETDDTVDAAPECIVNYDGNNNPYRTADLTGYFTYIFSVPEKLSSAGLAFILSGADSKIEVSKDNQNWVDLNVQGGGDAWYYLELPDAVTVENTTGKLYVKFSDKNTADGNGATLKGDLTLRYTPGEDDGSDEGNEGNEGNETTPPSTGDTQPEIKTVDVKYLVGMEPADCYTGSPQVNVKTMEGVYYRTTDLSYEMTYKFPVASEILSAKLVTKLTGTDAKVQASKDNQTWIDVSVDSVALGGDPNEVGASEIVLPDAVVTGNDTGVIHIKFSDVNPANGNGSTIWEFIQLTYTTKEAVDAVSDKELLSDEVEYTIGKEPEGYFEAVAEIVANTSPSGRPYRTCDGNYTMIYKFDVSKGIQGASISTILSGVDAKIEVSTDKKTWIDLEITPPAGEQDLTFLLPDSVTSENATGALYVRFGDKNPIDGNGATIHGTITLRYSYYDDYVNGSNGGNNNKPATGVDIDMLPVALSFVSFVVLIGVVVMKKRHPAM